MYTYSKEYTNIASASLIMYVQNYIKKNLKSSLQIKISVLVQCPQRWEMHCANGWNIFSKP